MGMYGREGGSYPMRSAYNALLNNFMERILICWKYCGVW